MPFIEEMDQDLHGHLNKSYAVKLTPISPVSKVSRQRHTRTLYRITDMSREPFYKNSASIVATIQINIYRTKIIKGLNNYIQYYCQHISSADIVTILFSSQRHLVDCGTVSQHGCTVSKQLCKQ